MTEPYELPRLSGRTQALGRGLWLLSFIPHPISHLPLPTELPPALQPGVEPQVLHWIPDCSPWLCLLSLGLERRRVPPVTLAREQRWEGRYKPGFQLGAEPWYLSGCDRIMHLLNITRGF